MRIAFVGVSRKYQELPPDYRNVFNQFHLEIPWYYARDGKNDVVIATQDYADDGIEFAGGGLLRCWKEENYRKVIAADPKFFDVVIHWRKWFQPMYCKGAKNFILSQDHSYSPQWKADVYAAGAGEVDGILCFPNWHEQYLKNSFSNMPWLKTISGLTLGVDTDIYKPGNKNPRTMLWASDPGRGLAGAVQLAVELWKRDKRYKLIVTYPDYVKERLTLNLPGIEVKHGVRNGHELWSLFNDAGVIPYTSTFPEPSSRVHRQGQAAGCMVLYPPNMGTPSDLIQDGKTGFVRDVSKWADLIIESVENGMSKVIGDNAREFALTENWAVQAKRFNETIGALL